MAVLCYIIMMNNLAFVSNHQDAKQERDENIMASETQRETLSRVKKRLLRSFPRYNSILKNRKIIDGGDNTAGGRGCTDGNNIWINAGMSEEEQMMVLAHEAKHIERDDCGKGVEDHELWNFVTDAVINDELESEGMSVRNGVKIEGAKEMGAEKLYEVLLKKKKGQLKEDEMTQEIVA